MNKKSLWILILLTPLFFIISHAIAYLAHEYSHSFSAWILGHKHNPLDLDYGDASWQNILFLEQVSENVNYASFSAQHPWAAAFIAFAGFGVGNVVLFVVSIIALRTKALHSIAYYYFFIWFAVMNLGNFIDYVPGRTFATHGDMQEIVSFLSISPWWLMVVLGYPICYSIWYFYSRVLPGAYAKLAFNQLQQIILHILIVYTLFMLFGAVGMNGYGPDSHFMALLSMYVAPIFLVACWPQRHWICKIVEKEKR